MEQTVLNELPANPCEARRCKYPAVHIMIVAICNSILSDVYCLCERMRGPARRLFPKPDLARADVISNIHYMVDYRLWLRNTSSHHVGTQHVTHPRLLPHQVEGESLVGDGE